MRYFQAIVGSSLVALILRIDDENSRASSVLALGIALCLASVMPKDKP